MRLNEYPKEELEILLECVENTTAEGNASDMLIRWRNIIKESIRDAEFQEKELPFPFDGCMHSVSTTKDGITVCHICHKEIAKNL